MSKIDEQKTASLIVEILAAIAAVGPIGVELYRKLETLLSLGPDEQENVAAAIKAGLDADTTTIQSIEEWKQQTGL